MSFPSMDTKGSQKERDHALALVLLNHSVTPSPNQPLTPIHLSNFDFGILLDSREQLFRPRLKPYVTDDVYVIQETEGKTIRRAFHVRKNYSHKKPKSIHEEMAIPSFSFTLISDLYTREVSNSLFIF